MKSKVIIAINTAWNLHNFRSGLIRAMIAEGYEVVAVAPEDEYAPRLAGLGCRYVALPMDNRGTHPGKDLLLLLRFLRLFRRERPDIFLSYTVKPNIYGSLAARLFSIPVISNISGLGSVFIKNNWLTGLVRALYRLALARSATVFFQNEDDRDLFVGAGMVGQPITDLLPGSGIDLAQFSPAPDGGRRRFLLIARLLWDKGVGEFVEAARIVRSRHAESTQTGEAQPEFFLLGFVDVQNPTAISRQQIAEWETEGVVHYLGASDDVRPYIAESDCVVLPSYREGTPRTLLEAAAMARPIIASDAVGCREVVEDGANGFLCKVRNSLDLAEKIELFISLSPERRAEMGRRGREKMEREFDERIVIQKYLRKIEQAIRPG